MPAAAGTADLLQVRGVTTVRNITLDGNLHNRGPYRDHQMEQSALIEARDATMTVSDVTLVDSPGDGICIRSGVVATITDVTATDCFRGGVTITGGDTDVTITRYTGGGTEAPAFVQMESAGGVPVEGMNLTIADSEMPSLQVEGHAESVVTVTGSTIDSGIWVHGLWGGQVVFEDCTINLTDMKPLNEVRYYVDVTFRRCTFTGSRLRLVPVTEGRVAPFCRLTFEDCTFTGEGLAAVYNEGTASGDGFDHLVTFAGSCTFVGFDAGYVLAPGRYGPVAGDLTPT